MGLTLPTPAAIVSSGVKTALTFDPGQARDPMQVPPRTHLKGPACPFFLGAEGHANNPGSSLPTLGSVPLTLRSLPSQVPCMAAASLTPPGHLRLPMRGAASPSGLVAGGPCGGRAAGSPTLHVASPSMACPEGWIRRSPPVAGFGSLDIPAPVPYHPRRWLAVSCCRTAPEERCTPQEAERGRPRARRRTRSPACSECSWSGRRASVILPALPSATMGPADTPDHSKTDRIGLPKTERAQIGLPRAGRTR